MWTDPTANALFQAILAAPEDDTPRLILADRLDEIGDSERGEFIRVQIALDDYLPRHDGACSACGAAEGDCHRTDCRLLALRRREQELLQAHQDDWLPDAIREATIFGSAAPERVAACLCYRRGFVEEIACTLEDWFRWVDIMLTEAPLRRVFLDAPPPPDQVVLVMATRWPDIAFMTRPPVFHRGERIGSLENIRHDAQGNLIGDLHLEGDTRRFAVLTLLLGNQACAGTPANS